jgi:hypothetical protein
MTGMNNDARRAERLAHELEASFRNRADLYRLLLAELTTSLGAQDAEALLVRAIEQRGREVAVAFRDFDPNQAREIGEAFWLSVPTAAECTRPKSIAEKTAFPFGFYVAR